MVLARVLRTRVDPAVHRMDLVPRTMQSVPAVSTRVHLLMEQDLMVLARVLRTLANPVVHRMDPAHRTMQSVPAVRTRDHLLMEHDLMVSARVLRTLANPAAHRMVPVHRTMQGVPAVHPQRLLMKASQEDGAVKTRLSPRKEKIVSSPSALGRAPVFFRDLDLTEAIHTIVF